MTETPKRCRWLIRPHRWTRWQRGEIRAVLGGVRELIQTRTCERCGKAQMETLW